MAVNSRQLIADLEAKIGPKVERDILQRLSLRDVAAAELRSALKLWLIKQGIPSRAANSAMDPSLASAYCALPYLRAWRKRLNPDWDLLGSDDDDDMDMAKVPPAAETSAAAVTSAQPEVDLKGLFKTLEEMAERLVNSKVSAADLKLGDNAKAQIKSLAEATAKAELAAHMPPRQIEIINTKREVTASLGLQHESFPLLLRAVQARNAQGFRLNIWLTGPTGSGKTTAAENVSKALEHTFASYRKDANGRWEILAADGTAADLNGLSHDAPFGADGSLDADYKVTGFKDANGKFHWTTFLRVFVFGGIYVADEIDNWSPSALLALNAALANGWISTPMGMLKRHPDACIIACANTWGLGANNDYVGRTRLDAASLDRFQPKISWPYDEKLERAIALNMAGTVGTDWHGIVLTARHAAIRQGLKVIVSPRATYNGIALLQAGFEPEEVIGMVITSGLSPEQVKALGLGDNPLASSRRDVA